MTKIAKAYDQLQSILEIIRMMNEAIYAHCKVGVYMIDNSYYCEDYEKDENYIYTEDDISFFEKMRSSAYDTLTNSLRDAGFTVETPYDDSIYITKDGENAISIRSHEVKNSTLMHWTSCDCVNIHNDTSDYLISILSNIN